ncbi:MAG: hypothetical protein Q9214_000720 [Letrouitia sp. 1 TL-2023]
MSMPNLPRRHNGSGNDLANTPVLESSALPITSPLVPTPKKRKHWARQYRTEIAASSSNSVKTRMQAYRFHHFIDCIQHTYKTEGFKGFWRGSLAPLASITLVRTVSFSIYQKAKYSYSAAIGQATGEEPLITVNRPGSIPTFGTIACFGTAGATAGGIVAAIACPFELTKLQDKLRTERHF